LSLVEQTFGWPLAASLCIEVVKLDLVATSLSVLMQFMCSAT